MPVLRNQIVVLSAKVVPATSLYSIQFAPPAGQEERSECKLWFLRMGVHGEQAKFPRLHCPSGDPLWVSLTRLAFPSPLECSAPLQVSGRCCIQSHGLSPSKLWAGRSSLLIRAFGYTNSRLQCATKKEELSTTLTSLAFSGEYVNYCFMV